MAENHGINIRELPFTPLTVANDSITVPFVVGTAPVHLSERSKLPINEPIYLENIEQAKRILGYSDDWDTFTLCEVMDAFFNLYQQSPIVMVNVIDPTKHKKTVAATSMTLVKGALTIKAQGVLPKSVIVQSTDGTTTYVRDTDYTTAVDGSTGQVVVNRTPTSAIALTGAVRVSYEQMDISKVAASDLIGGTNGTTGAVTGLELIKQVYPRFAVVPSLLLAPGFSSDPTIAAVMRAKTSKINGNFQAFALTDLPANIPYMDLGAWKEDNGYGSSAKELNLYPMVSYNGRKYRYSTHMAGAICRTDSESAGVPYRSPSNKQLVIDSAVMADGVEIALGVDEANYLNSQGIMTTVRFPEWKSWGNRTALYPSATDPQNTFISVRRMFNWIGNTLITRYFSRIDEPTNKRLITSVVDDANIWLNGLTSNDYLLGGRVDFLAADNSATSLVEGILKFRVSFAPPSPAQQLDFLLAYDSSYLSAITAE